MTGRPTADLAAWLTAIWDEEERLAKLAGGDRWILDGSIVHESHPSRDVVDWVYDEADEHIAYHDPASVLARIAADRAILEDYKRLLFDDPFRRTDYFRGQRDALEYVVKHKAEQYADRPGFRSEWLVERQGAEKDGRETARHYAQLEENEMRETYGG